jgi:ABC-type nitrate/sulfonate/bicarbonate transport system permease component
MAEVSLERVTESERAGFLTTELRIQIGTILGVWASWEALAQSGLFYRDIVPSSLRVFAAMWRHLSEAEFYHHLGVTSYEVLVGFAIGSIAGIGLGILFGVRRFLGRVMDGYILALAPAPKVVFLPILMVVFGIGMGSKIAMAALSAFFPVVLSTVAGMHLVNPTLIRVGKMFNASPWQMVTKVYMPSLVLPVVTGLRLGLGVAIIGTLVAEIKLAKAGLGFLAIQNYELFRIPEMYSVIIIIFALAMGANAIMTKLTDRLTQRGMPKVEVSGAS